MRWLLIMRVRMTNKLLFYCTANSMGVDDYSELQNQQTNIEQTRKNRTNKEKKKNLNHQKLKNKVVWGLYLLSSRSSFQTAMERRKHFVSTPDCCCYCCVKYMHVSEDFVYKSVYCCRCASTQSFFSSTQMPNDHNLRAYIFFFLQVY